jgi:hypothetical protein
MDYEEIRLEVVIVIICLSTGPSDGTRNPSRCDKV